MKLTYVELRKPDWWFCPECGKYADENDKDWQWNRWSWLHYCSERWHAAEFSPNNELVREMIYNLNLSFEMMQVEFGGIYDLNLGTYLDAIMYVLRDRRDLLEENKRLREKCE